ncbi:hypothetical protein HBI23_144880 [Parastagonospora nodorum]|nr:hypothetical protein HBH78_088730 [Parastagonospora nodorum]KAH4812620.1 hypothetical protein HBH61_081660 [Parastagonospora nodorum]KAH4960054.1 hypothetical protein HBH73_077640 [Parastagonospora nodorum]KAH5656470.1 hypothetical protein HBI23_144880 [Parastagonospora nodorum]
MYMKDLDATIESLGFQLTPLEAFVEAELARRNTGGEPISKTQEQAYTGAKTSRALKHKWGDKQPSQSRQQPEDEEVLKIADSAEPRGSVALESTNSQSGPKHQGRLAAPAPSTSITAAPRVPNRGDSSWGQREYQGGTAVRLVSNPEPRFHEGEQVHMSEKIGSSRMKGSYLISKSRFSSSKAYTEYQLLEPLTQLLHNKGAWYREKDLKQAS